MSVEELLSEYDGVKYLANYDYDSAIIGITHDDRVVYDYDLMVKYLMDKEGWTMEDSIEWIEYNTIRALPYFGEGSPVIMFNLKEKE